MGFLVGLVLGVIPGLGVVVGLTLLIPFTYRLDTYSSFALLLGMAAVTTISDLIPAVMFGVPGSVGAAAPVIDGHALAKKGQAGRALGAGYAEMAIIRTSIARDPATVDFSLAAQWQGARDALRHWWLVFVAAGSERCSGRFPVWARPRSIGSPTGMRSFGKEKSMFGEGDIRGVIAPEASNNSKRAAISLQP